MIVLGIESSCDETAAAVVADGERILSSVVASQTLTHEKFGGVVPELASREHLRKIVPVVEEACRRAGVTVREVDGIAVTEGPGLVGSLLVGLVYGKALARALEKPLVGINHLEGHIHAVLLENKLARRGGLARQAGCAVEEARLPAVTLVVSGGHTSLFRVEASRVEGGRATAFSYQLLGQTRDDAAGEAFDKVAKLLALGYPGGPIIDALGRFGNSNAVELGRIKMKGNPLDFSFSGLKTAVLYRVRGTDLAREAEERRAWRQAAGGTGTPACATPSTEAPRQVGVPPLVSAEEIRLHCSPATLDLVSSFQHAVVADLVERTLAAAEDCGVPSVLVSGGVACNSLLRERFAEAAKPRGLAAFFPSPALSTDNAAMIAAAGYYRLAAGKRSDSSLTAHASLPLGT